MGGRSQDRVAGSPIQMNAQPSASQRTILITGASSGIGAGLALEFARRGYGVAIAARRVDRLEALATQLQAAGAAMVALIPLDVADTDAIEPAVRRAAAELGRLDVIVANAGVGPVTPTGRGKLPLMRETLNINLVGAIATIEAALPIFRAPGAGPGGGLDAVPGPQGFRGLQREQGGPASLPAVVARRTGRHADCRHGTCTGLHRY